ncbi:MAG: sodium:solute symporter family transporter [Candidatus Amoebophilus sp.]
MPVVAAGVVIIYSVFGGIRAITFTDVIQFFTFGTFIPILALVIWNQLKDPHQVITLLNTNPNFSWSQVISWSPKFRSTLSMFLWFLIPAMDPVIFQRISMARDVAQVRQSFNYAGLISLGVCLFLAWVAILLLANNPSLEPDKLFNYVINNYTPSGLRGLIGVGVLALAMSTADSCLNASAVLLTNDIAKPLGIQFKNEVIAARVLCLVSGLFALLITLQFKGILALLQFANSLYMPVVTVPLLLAILGFRSSTLSVLLGMGMGFLTVIGWPLIYKGGDSIIPGIVANLVGLLGSHYILKQPGGWVGIREPEPLLEARENRRKAWKRFKKDFKEFSLVQYLQKTFPNQDYLLTIFGIYVIAATYASFYTVPEEIQTNHARLYHIIGQSVLFISTGLLTYPLWPPIFKNKWFITWAWPLSVFYVLFGVGTWLVLMSGFHTFQTMIFLLNIVMAFLLFDWPFVVTMVFSGVIIATNIFKLFASAPSTSNDFGTLQFKILYGLLLLSSFLLAIFKHKQAQKQLASRNEYLKLLQAERDEKLKVALEYRERFSNALSTDCVEGFMLLYQRGKELIEAAKQVQNEEQAKAFMEDVLTLLAKQQQAGEYLAETIYRFKEHMRLDVQKVDLTDFLDATLENLDMIDLQPRPKVTVQLQTQQRAIQCDPRLIQKLLYNSLRSIQEKNQDNKPIRLIVEDASLVYDIPFIPNYAKKLPAIQFMFTTVDQLSAKKNSYEVIEPVNIFLPKHIEDLARAENEQIIDAHYGSASWEADIKGLTQIYVIPVEIRRIRPALMDEPQMVLDNKGQTT